MDLLIVYCSAIKKLRNELLVHPARRAGDGALHVDPSLNQSHNSALQDGTGTVLADQVKRRHKKDVSIQLRLFRMSAAYNSVRWRTATSQAIIET